MIFIYVFGGALFFGFLYFLLKKLLGLKVAAAVTLILYVALYIVGAILLFSFVDSTEKLIIYVIALTGGIGFRLYYFFRGYKSA